MVQKRATTANKINWRLRECARRCGLVFTRPADGRCPAVRDDVERELWCRSSWSRHEPRHHGVRQRGIGGGGLHDLPVFIIDQFGERLGRQAVVAGGVWPCLVVGEAGEQRGGCGVAVSGDLSERLLYRRLMPGQILQKRWVRVGTSRGTAGLVSYHRRVARDLFAPAARTTTNRISRPKKTRSLSLCMGSGYSRRILLRAPAHRSCTTQRHPQQMATATRGHRIPIPPPRSYPSLLRLTRTSEALRRSSSRSD